MSYIYGGYNPKAPNGTTGSSQAPTASATGRKFAVMPGKLGIGLGYSKPIPKPAAASQVPAAPAAASPTPSTAAAAAPAAAPSTSSPQISPNTTMQPHTAVHAVVKKEQTPTPPPTSHQPVQYQILQPQQSRPHPQQMQHQQHGHVPHNGYAAAPRPGGPVRAAGGARVLMPVIRSVAPLGYSSAQVRQPVVQPVMMKTSLGYGGGSSYPSNLSLNVPLREPSPEPMPVMMSQPEVKKEEYNIEDDYKVYGTVNDIDIQVRNVVCNYTLPLHIDLRKLAQNTNNVTFDRGRGVLMKQKRNPMCYVKIYSSGKVYIVGCRSEADCMKAARRIARNVQRAMNKLNTEVRIRNYRVCNVLATCKMPFGVKIEEVASAYPSESQYEPELSVGLVWRNKEPKATLRIHTTGSVTVTGAQSEADVYTVIERLYPILLKYKCPPRSKGDLSEAARRKREAAQVQRKRYQQFSSGYEPRSKMSRVESGIVGGRVVFSDEEDEDDIYDPAFYDE